MCGVPGQRVVRVSRRSFFASLLGACAGLIVTVIGTPMLRYILYPVQAGGKSSKWTEVGDVSEFEKIEGPLTKTIALTQRDGWREVVSRQSVFVNRSSEWQTSGPVADLSAPRMFRGLARKPEQIHMPLPRRPIRPRRKPHLRPAPARARQA